MRAHLFLVSAVSTVFDLRQPTGICTYMLVITDYYVWLKHIAYANGQLFCKPRYDKLAIGYTSANMSTEKCQFQTGG